MKGLEEFPEPAATKGSGGRIFTDLLERLRAATGSDRRLDGEIDVALNEGDGEAWPAPYTASLDAALALVERVLPGWSYGLVQRRDKCRVAADLFHVEQNICRGTVEAPTAPLAVLIALLTALEDFPHV